MTGLRMTMNPVLVKYLPFFHFFDGAVVVAAAAIVETLHATSLPMAPIIHYANTTNREYDLA